MKQTICLFAFVLFIYNANAQKNYVRNGKVSPNVPTKTLKKLLESNYNRGSHKNVIAISDTLLKRNRNDNETREKRIVSEIKLKLDQKAIADIKVLKKNKDTAATYIAAVPVKFYGIDDKRAAVYCKSAIAYAPKNGIPHVLYAAVLADAGKGAEALTNVEKGWALLNGDYKTQMQPMYALIQHESGKKELAYQLLEDLIDKGDYGENLVSQYFKFYAKDDKLQQGIDKATSYYTKTNNLSFIAERANLYHKSSNNEKACEDAATIKNEAGSDFYQVEFECPQIMADAKPNINRTYIYKVDFQGKDYDFRVSNPDIDMDNGASFRYKMTGENNISGKVKISKEALATAHDQHNNFANGDADLTDKTSVWVSKEVFKELKTNGVANMGADPWGAKEYKVVESDDQESKYYPVIIDGETKYIKCIKVASEDGQEIWIADDEKNPLILKMDISFKIELIQLI